MVWASLGWPSWSWQNLDGLGWSGLFFILDNTGLVYYRLSWSEMDRAGKALEGLAWLGLAGLSWCGWGKFERSWVGLALGWAVLSWAWMGWAGLGLAWMGWVRLGWTGQASVDWAEQGLCWAGLGWAGAGSSGVVRTGLVWAGQGSSFIKISLLHPAQFNSIPGQVGHMWLTTF
jgi:hypothetical protein